MKLNCVLFSHDAITSAICIAHSPDLLRESLFVGMIDDLDASLLHSNSNEEIIFELQR